MNASKVLVGFFGFCVALGLNAVAQGGASTPQARANELQSRYMTAVRVDLTSKLDTKNAMVGMVLTARTEAAVTLADGTEIPAGTKLMGHVVAVHARPNDGGESMATVTFDQAQIKDGKMIPVRTLIRAMSTVGAPPVDNAPPGTRGLDSDPMGAPGGLGGGSTGSGASGSKGGGMGGGNSSGGLGGARGRPTQPMAGMAPPDAAAASPVTSTAEGGETVRVAPKPTGVPGVLLYASPTSDVSGTLIGYDKNIHLDNGVQLTLGMISRQAPASDSGVK